MFVIIFITFPLPQVVPWAAPPGIAIQVLLVKFDRHIKAVHIVLDADLNVVNKKNLLYYFSPN